MDGIISKLFSSEAEELYVLDCSAYFMMLMAACTFLTLLFENVPYGRYASSKYGFPVNVKFAWFVQELPAFWVPVCLVVWTSCARTSLLPNQLLLAMYFCHYVQRSLIYPFLIRGGKSTPFLSFALAVVFCIYNGYMQVRYISHYAQYPADWVTHPCFILGSALWLVGWIVNIHSDHILRNLRKPGETGYKIPVDYEEHGETCQDVIHTRGDELRRMNDFKAVPLAGGMFEYVSGANFFGEIVEWTGFSLAAHSIHSAAFAVFTLTVLASRAVAHHKWYLTKFEDYPKSRKALLPFLF